MTETTLPPDPARAGLVPTAPGAPGAFDLVGLRADVAGPVYGPDDVEVVTELAGFNLAPEHAPCAVVGATSAEDVAVAVRWAAARGLPVGVLATGHGGVEHRGGVVVTVRRLDRVVVDPVARTATVGGGARWAQVVEAAAPFGLAGLSGSSTDVGVVGYTLGGGIGPFVRRHGLAVDRVRRMQVVTGDGAVREVDAQHDPELFRALLGGADLAGIVTEMTVDLVALRCLYGGGLFYDTDDVAAVLHAWCAWAPTLPREMTTSIAIVRVPDHDTAPPPLRGRTVAHLRVAHLGSAESGVALLAPMRAVASPLLDTVGGLPYRAVDAVHMDPVEPVGSWSTGAFLRDVDAATVDTLLDLVGPDRRVPLAVVELRHVDGAMGDPAEAGTPAAGQGCVPREGARFVVGVVGVVAPTSPELRRAVPLLGQGVIEALAPWCTGGVPLTWASPQALEDHGVGWSASERARLRAVTARCDPAGVLAGRRLGVT